MGFLRLMRSLTTTFMLAATVSACAAGAAPAPTPKPIDAAKPTANPTSASTPHLTASARPQITPYPTPTYILVGQANPGECIRFGTGTLGGLTQFGDLQPYIVPCDTLGTLYNVRRKDKQGQCPADTTHTVTELGVLYCLEEMNND